MKLSLLKASGIAVLVAGFFSGSALAASLITGSKHDLTGAYTPGVVAGTGDEICVFCHTPHAADNSSATNPPLWNRALGGLVGYTMYSTTTIDGYTAANPSGSISIACLSCHDGSMAVNTLINAPGSGLASGWEAGTWSGAGGVNAISGKLDGSAALLGKDLTNDHPISIQYGGGPTGAGAISIVDGIGSYTVASMKDKAFFPLNLVTSNGKRNWYRDMAGGAAGTRDKTDLLLFTRDGTASTYGDQEPFVECATCHDPHGTANATFLRASNINSALCLGCHDK